ncbi:hypothetical protein D9756_007075 [Leucocoprinus leucothites]|uniref:Uncharacterized protein n=1 Tax=Leucocoprinus leucothites TaxID=201217 RepID=A0A8H5D5J0_9AGAR|nr:hypothetical protein D9756_007075 [Leucoagaricus leucothites]
MQGLYNPKLPANLWESAFYIALWRSNAQPYTFYFCRSMWPGKESGTQWQLGGAGYPYKKEMSPVNLVNTPGLLGLFCLNWRYKDWDGDSYQKWFKLFDAAIANSQRVERDEWLGIVLRRMLDRYHALILLRPKPRSEYEDLEEEIEDFVRVQMQRAPPRSGRQVTVYTNFFRKI